MRASHPRTGYATLPWVLAAITAGAALLAYRRRAGTRPRLRDRSGSGPVTQAIVPGSPADRDLGAPGQNIDRRLDEAIEETFPASDPISVHIE